MTNLIEQLKTAGIVTARGCVLKIKGDRYHMSRGDSAHSIDIDSSCERRLAAHWSGFVDTCGSDDVVAVVELKPVAPVAKPAIKRPLREYVLTMKAADGSEDDTDGHVETVFARDRNEAMRKGRDIVRENVGPHGQKIKISARLK